LEKPNATMRPKFSPILDQYYYHVIKRTTPPAWRKNVAKNFSFSRFCIRINTTESWPCEIAVLLPMENSQPIFSKN